jgi:hypothetical protein
VAALVMVSGPVLGECRRLQTSLDGQNLDGSGSFGALHGTVTLDCLRYAGSVESEGREWVLIRDELGTVHRLKVGDYMGENSGVIKAIDDRFIYIRQLIRNADDEQQAVTVKFPKH